MFRKEYTDAQYKKFLQTQFRSSFGIENAETKVARYVSTHCTNHWYNFSYSTILHTYIPYLKKHLGGSGYIMFLLITSVEGGAATCFGFLNHTYRSTNWELAMRDDIAYIKLMINHPQYSVANGDPYGGIGYMPTSGTNKARKVLSSCGRGSIGRYYIPSTLAGNGWVFAYSWARVALARYGNAYDQIIDIIRSLGGKPFAGIGSGSGGSAPDQGEGLNINLPKAVYLNNSEFSILGVHFKRYRNWLFIHYPFNLGSGASIGEGDSGSGETDVGKGGNKKKIDEIVAEAKRVKAFNKKHKLRYVMVHPQPSPYTSGRADCSGFVGWCCHKAYPAMWAGGTLYTGSMLVYARAHNWIVWRGSQMQLLRDKAKIVHTGDILIMGHDPSCGAGGSSHTALVYEGSGLNAKVLSMEYYGGLLDHPLHYFLKNWWQLPAGFPYMYVCRPK